MPQETKSITPHSDTDLVVEGAAFDDSSKDVLAEALRKTVDYRGDVTLHLRDGSRIDGYLYDHRDQPRPEVRVMPRDADERRIIPVEEIQRLEITGKDTAAGKTFENWVKRYVEKKLAGQVASIESEPLV